MHFCAFFIGLRNHRKPASLAAVVMLALLVVFTAAAFPVNSFLFEDDEVGGSDFSPVLSPAVPLVSALHLPLLASRSTDRVREREHLRARTVRRRSADRLFDSGEEAGSTLLSFICLSLLLILVSHQAASIRMAEYLKSHIGEKRFADGMIASPVSALVYRSLVTVPGGVPSLFCSFPRASSSMSGSPAPSG